MPLTHATKNMITKQELELMKTDAMIINTCRGGIINENDLYDAMKCFVDDTSLIALMGKESAEYAREKFSLETITKQYLEVIS